MLDDLALPSTVGEGQEPDGVRALGEVTIIYDRMGGNETIVKVFGDQLEAIAEFRKMRHDPDRLLSLTTRTVQRAETPVRHETQERPRT